MNFKDLPVGIDLGTTNSCIGVFRNGSVEIIPNEITGRTMPSVVSFCDKIISIGDQTKNKIFDDPSKVIDSIKRIIGKTFYQKDVKNLIENLTYKDKIFPDEQDRIFLKIERNGKEGCYSPQEISSMILKRLKEIAEDYLDQEIKEVVITIPAYFNETQREATKAAAEVVGFKVLKIINEPTAAALAYGLREKNDLLKSEEDDEYFLFSNKENEKENVDKKNILVFDLGGGTLDVTCLKYFNDEDGPEFRIKGHSGNPILGGNDFDNKLIDYCIEIFEKENKIKIDKDSDAGIFALKRLKNYCEEVKKILSKKTKHKVIIESLYENEDLNLDIDRTQFENLCREYFDKLKDPIEEALKISGFKKEDINEILLVGGSTRIPKIKNIITEYFGEKIKINDSINPDEVVAYGATLQAGICMKEKSLKNVIIYDICSHSLGTDIKGNDIINGDICDNLIENGTVVPIEIEKTYETAYDYQTSVSVQLYEGEKKFCKDNEWLGGLYLNNIHKAKKGETKIKIRIKIDENSIIHLSAEEKVSGENKSIDIIYKNGILRKEELKEIENRLNNKEDFEKSIYNQEEKELNKKKLELRKEYLEIKSLKSFIEMVKIQEKLVEISLNNFNQNNFEKKFSNIKFLFKYYNCLFNTYKEEYLKQSESYVSKIKKYLSIFKNDQPFYIKTLVLIFKDDNYDTRISEIVMYSIQLIKKYIKEIKKKKFIAFYYDEILEIINIFDKVINRSSDKKKFNAIKFECLNNRENLVINSLIRIESWDKKVDIKSAFSEIDHLTITIENFRYSKSEKSKRYEKPIRAFMLTRLSHLELRYFSICNLPKLEKYINEALSLVKECNLNDKWINYLNRNKNIIEQKKKEKKLKESTEIKCYKDEIDRIKNTQINGEDDETNILFFEFLFENIKKDRTINVRNLYKNNKKNLIKKAKQSINDMEYETDDGKGINSWLNSTFNIIFNVFEHKKLID